MLLNLTNPLRAFSTSVACGLQLLMALLKYA